MASLVPDNREIVMHYLYMGLNKSFMFLLSSIKIVVIKLITTRTYKLLDITTTKKSLYIAHCNIHQDPLI